MTTRLLYIDDDLGKPYETATAAELSRRGFDVEGHSDAQEGIDRAIAAPPDALVLDLRLQEQSGLDVARKVLRFHPSLPVVFLSGFVSEFPDIRRRISPLAPVRVVAKQDHDHGDRAAAAVADAVAEIYKPRGHRADISDAVGEPAVFQVTLQQFDQLDDDAQADWILAAAQAASPYTNAVFSETRAAWIVLCGGPTMVIAYGESLGQSPSDDDLRRWSASAGRPALLCTRPIEVDDYGDWQECEVGDWYPSLAVDFGGALTLEAHFDTGNPRTLLSFELIRDAGLVPAKGPWRAGTRNPGIHFAYRLFSMTGNLMAGLASPAVAVNAFAVRGWRGGTFDRMCGSGLCPGSERTSESARFHCGRRDGLFGRNLLLDNRLSITLDAGERKTSLQS